MSMPHPGFRFPASFGAWRALAGRLSGALALLLALTLTLACHKSSTNTAAPGTPPTITVQPSDAATVTGRSVTFSITATGAPTLRYQWTRDGVAILGALDASFTLVNPKVADAGQYRVVVTNPNGTATSNAATLSVAAALQFASAVAVAADPAGNLFVSDSANHVIWKVSTSKQVTLLAGSAGVSGSADGQGASARFAYPGGLAVEAAGSLLVADTGNHTVRRVAADGTVTTLAGTPGVPGTADGSGVAARFNGPSGLVLDGTGGAFVSDTQNHTIRHLSATYQVTTLAGKAGSPGKVDAAGTAAQFNEPNGLALASDGTLFVADYGNSLIRAVSASGAVTTLAGQTATTGTADGTGTAAQFNLPVGLALDASRNLWVADTRNHTLRRIVPATGAVTTVAGVGGTRGNVDSTTGTSASFNTPCALALTPSGALVVADTGNHLLRSVSAGSPYAVTTL